MRLSEEEFQRTLAFARQYGCDDYRCEDGAILFGETDAFSGEAARHFENELSHHLKKLGPWRKGPFDIYGHRLDANWRSDLKWERISRFLDDMNGKAICDVGCNNGYFLWQLARQQPESLLGLDPKLEFYRQYQFLSAFCEPPNTEFKLAGYEYLKECNQKFELVLAMGVIYHHPEPLEILRILKGALKSGGQLIVETLALPGKEQPLALTPTKRYAGVGGVWFVPNELALVNWLRRSGFRDIKIEGIYSCQGEQLRTEYGDLPAFEEGLNSANPNETIEGYPAPVRLYVSARR